MVFYSSKDSLSSGNVCVKTPIPTHRVHGRVSLARSVGGFSQIEGMSEELKFKLEMRRMELECKKNED